MMTRPVSSGRFTNVVLAAYLLSTLAQTTRGAPKPRAGPNETGLIVWVFTDDKTGIAIALHELRDAPNVEIQFETITQGKWKPASIRDAIRALSDKAPPHLKVKIQQIGKGQGHYLVFKFCPDGKLLDLWKPLYNRLVASLPNTDPVCKDANQWRVPLNKEAWLSELGEDVKPMGGKERVVILGPDGSDSVPALWFALRHGRDEGATYPLTFDLAATSSLLERERLSQLSKTDDKSILMHPNWQTSLGRMVGYCEDDLAHATLQQRKEVWAVLRAIHDPAQFFIQFADSDRMLVESSIRYLCGVQGLSRIGILYPDQQRPSGDSDQGHPDSLLYGPTLRDQYRSQLGPRRLLSASYMSSSAWERNRDKGLGDWLRRRLGVIHPAPSEAGPEGGDRVRTYSVTLAEQLRPTLSFFRQSGVGAVGVFGVIDDKLEVLALARKELPDAQLFTADANWRLESPRSGAAGSGGSAKDLARGDAPLEGLLVFTNTEAERAWVEGQFVAMGPLLGGAPCLPDIFQYTTHHVVERLLDLTRDGDFWKLDEKPGDCCIPRRGDVVRGKSTIVPTDSACGGHKLGLGGIQVMIIRNGVLKALSDPDDWWLALGLSVVALAGLSLQWIRADAASRREIEPVSPLYYIYDVSRKGLIRATGRPRGGSSIDEGVKDTWVRQTSPETLFTSLGLCAFLLAVVLSLRLDAWLLHRSVSWSPWPDGHSILPSLVLAGLSGIIAHHLPYRFEVGLRRQGLLTRRPDAQPGHPVGGAAAEPSAPADSWVLRRWVPSFSRRELEDDFDKAVESWIKDVVVPNLKCSRSQAVWSLLIAVFLTLVDLCAGLPVHWGITTGILALGEVILFWVFLSTAWTLYRVSEMPAKLEAVLKEERLRLGYLDTSSVSRMGSIFIETIAYLLVVLGLLLVARLPEFGMAYWRKLMLEDIPIGGLLTALTLTLVLWYWLHCYTSLKALIRSIKSDRLKEWEQLRTSEIARLEQDRRDDEGKYREKLKELTDYLERQRRAVEDVSEEPWRANASWRAWVTLALILLPSVLPTLLGPWSDTLIRAMRALSRSS